MDRLHDWGGKLAGAALRIAGLLSAACCRDLPPQRIQHAEMERATALCAALISHAIAAFNLVDEDPRVTLAKCILRWLCKQEGPNASKRDCFRALHRQFDQVGDMDAPLQVLIDHFYIKTRCDEDGRRPSR